MNYSTIRPPTAAGSFYPADSANLEADIRRYLIAVNGPDDCEDYPLVKAIIVPHDAYPRSGPVAAPAYLQLACTDIPVRRFVIVGATHAPSLHGLAISGADAFETPLGVAHIDEAARSALLALGFVTVDDTAHGAAHNAELQLPFLQELFLDFTIVPLLVGRATVEEVAAALECVWGGPDTRLILSADPDPHHDWTNAGATWEPNGNDEDGPPEQVTIAALLRVARRHGLQVEAIHPRIAADSAGMHESAAGYHAFVLKGTAPAAY